MNSIDVVKKLNKKYPGKKIIKNDEDNPTEILCEAEPTTDHSEYSLAIAVIDKCVPHIHEKSIETYKVIKGKLTLYIDGKKYELDEDEEKVIKPGQTHWAHGNETWVECYSEPGWTFEDHIISK
jgi:mannose-6-phosphate isomerase-like protein (cupin superfamily)